LKDKLDPEIFDIAYKRDYSKKGSSEEDEKDFISDEEFKEDD